MTGTAREHLETLTRIIPDFPQTGIVFRDVTPVLADASALAAVVDELAEPFAGGFDVVAGVEARGFPLAGAIAARSGTGLLLIRRAGKLPGEHLTESYALEYGTADLEVHAGQLAAGTRVLIVDDVLATGGTLGAARRLVERAGWVPTGLAVVIELAALAEREALAPHDVHALWTV
jgi:adenine phosphoribosyltransferase